MKSAPPGAAHLLRWLAVAALLARVAQGQQPGPVPADAGAEAPVADVGDQSPAVEAALLLAEADALRVSSPEEAVAALLLYDRAAVLATAAADDRILALARLGRAHVLLSRGEASDAAPTLEEALAPARRTGDADLQTAVLRAAADADAALGRFGPALARLRAVAVLAEKDLRFAEAGFARLDAAEASRLAGLPGDARDEADRAVAHFRSAGDAGLERQALERRAALEREAGAPERALDTLAEARALAWDAGDPARAGRLLLEMGRVRRSLGRADAALAEILEAQETCREVGDAACEADAHEELSSLHLALDDPGAAARSALATHVLRRAAGDAAGEGRASHALGVALRRLGRREPALSALEEAGRLLAAHGETDEQVELELSRARTLAAMGRASDAAAAHDVVLGRLQTLGATSGRFEPRVDAEQVLAEHLASLADGALWARALEVSIAYRSARTGIADPLHAGGPGSPSLDVDVLRTVALLEAAPLLAWHALEDSLLAWAIRGDGFVDGVRVGGLSRSELARLAASARAAAATPPARADATEAEIGEPPRAEAIDAALRRLHDALLVPLARASASGDGAHAPRLVAWQAAELSGVPLALLQDEAGRSLGEATVVAELPSADLPRADPRSGDVLVVTGPDARAATVEAVREALAPPRVAPPRTSDRDRPGRRAPPSEPAPAGPAPPPARFVDGPREAGFLAAAAADAAVVAWLDAPATLQREVSPGVDAPRATALPLAGAVVVLADEPSAALVDALMVAGTRSVLSTRGDLGDADRARATALLLTRLSAGEGVSVALRGTWEALRDEGWLRPWGAFRVVGSLR